MKIVPCCPPYNPHLETQIRSPTIFRPDCPHRSELHCCDARNVPCTGQYKSFALAAVCAHTSHERKCHASSAPARFSTAFPLNARHAVSVYTGDGMLHVRFACAWATRHSLLRVTARERAAAFAHIEPYPLTPCSITSADIHFDGMVSNLHNCMSAARGIPLN